jgi:hypothetical protein
MRSKKRGPQNFLAGDDNPFFRYKRQKFLARFRRAIEFNSKVVLEGSRKGQAQAATFFKLSGLVAHDE